MKFRLSTIFIASFVLLTPLAAGATQCCYTDGQFVPVEGSSTGGYYSPATCDIKSGSCAAGTTEKNCNADSTCQKKLPICCIYTYTDTSKKTFCYEDADQSFDCAAKTQQPADSTLSTQISRCSDLPQCTGTQGDTLSPSTNPSAPAAAVDNKKWTGSDECTKAGGQWANNDCYAIPKPVTIGVSIGGLTQATISQYLAAVFNLGIGIAAILAIIFIMIGGFRYIAAAGGGEVEQGKSMIKNAIIGLVLALLSYTLLQTVNPAILSLSLPPIKLIKQPPPADNADNSGCAANAATGTIPVGVGCDVKCQKGCVAGARCVVSADNIHGVCVSGAENTACEINDAQSPCAPGFTCCEVSTGAGTCQKSCTNRALGSTCTAGSDCSSSGICATIPSFTGPGQTAGSKFCSTGGNGKYCSDASDCSPGHYCSTQYYDCGNDCPLYRVCSSQGSTGQICCDNAECKSGSCIGSIEHGGKCTITNGTCGVNCGTCK